jgi:hypothetical protein
LAQFLLYYIIETKTKIKNIKKIMKTVKEMSNVELVETLNVMEAIDSPEAKKLAKDIKAEQARREEEREAARKAAEERKKAEEAKREAEAAKSEDELVEKQKSVLGKCYKKVFYDTNYLMPTIHYTVYYKVTGVYDDKAVVSFVKVYNHSEMVSRAITFVNINDLLDKTEKYETITRKEFANQYNLAKSSFEDITDVLKRAFAWF